MINNIVIVAILWCFFIIIVRIYYINIEFKTITDKHEENFKLGFKTSNCWISNDEFPEAQKIFDSKDEIIEELSNILNSDKWGIWSSDYNSTPIFTKMTDCEILSRIKLNSGKINSGKNPSWRLFGLILNKKILSTGDFCPKTIKILQSASSRILNAGFSVLEPGCYIGEHKDFDNGFYRLHIPLIIPKINETIKHSFITKTESENLSVLQVESDYRIWKNNEYFIFDDTCLHNAWNKTSDMRIVLLVDLLNK